MEEKKMQELNMDEMEKVSGGYTDEVFAEFQAAIRGEASPNHDPYMMALDLANGGYRKHRTFQQQWAVIQNNWASIEAELKSQGCRACTMAEFYAMFTKAWLSM